MVRIHALLASLVLAATTVAAVNAQTPQASADRPVFASLSPGRYWNGPEAANLKRLAQSHPIVPTWWAKDLERFVGLRVDQIERVAVVMPEPNTCVFAITVVAQTDLAKAKQTLTPNGRESRVRDARVWISDQSGYACCPLSDRTFVIGKITAMTRFFDRDASAWGFDRLKPPEGLASSNTLLEFEASPLLAAPVIQATGHPDDYRALGEAKKLRLVVETDGGLRLTLRAEYASEADAQGAPAAMKKLVDGLDAVFALAQQQFPKFFKAQEQQYPGARDLSAAMDTTLQAARTGLKEAATAQTGNVVETRIVIKTDQPASTAVLLLTLMPRARK